MEGKKQNFQRKLALAWVSGTISLRGSNEPETPVISMGKPDKSYGRILQVVNHSMCKGRETGESWACLSFCREARVTGAEQSGDWKEE